MQSRKDTETTSGEVHPRSDHEDPKGEQRYCSTLSLTLALDGRWVVVMPWPLYPQERPGTHCVGGWVGPRVTLDGVPGIWPPTRIRFLDRPALSESLY
jgi:hypothetical protein